MMSGSERLICISMNTSHQQAIKQQVILQPEPDFPVPKTTAKTCEAPVMAHRLRLGDPIVRGCVKEINPKPEGLVHCLHSLIVINILIDTKEVW